MPTAGCSTQSRATPRSTRLPRRRRSPAGSSRRTQTSGSCSRYPGTSPTSDDYEVCRPSWRRSVNSWRPSVSASAASPCSCRPRSAPTTCRCWKPRCDSGRRSGAGRWRCATRPSSPRRDEPGSTRCCRATAWSECCSTPSHCSRTRPPPTMGARSGSRSHACPRSRNRRPTTRSCAASATTTRLPSSDRNAGSRPRAAAGAVADARTGAGPAVLTHRP